MKYISSVSHLHIVSLRVGFLPWQKLFLPGQWKKPVKTVAKTSKNRQKLAKSKTP